MLTRLYWTSAVGQVPLQSPSLVRCVSPPPPFSLGGGNDLFLRGLGGKVLAWRGNASFLNGACRRKFLLEDEWLCSWGIWGIRFWLGRGNNCVLEGFGGQGSGMKRNGCGLDRYEGQWGVEWLGHYEVEVRWATSRMKVILFFLKDKKKGKKIRRNVRCILIVPDVS